MKDISLAEFLAEQIANRIKMDFREDKKLADKFLIRSSKGAYLAKPAQAFFKIEVLADHKSLEEFIKE